MSICLKSVPFFTGNIEMSEILAATSEEALALEGKPIQAVINDGRASLQEYDDMPGHYLLMLDSGEFVEFIEK